MPLGQGGSLTRRQSVESRDYCFFWCLILNPLDVGAVLDILRSLELRPFVSGFHGVSSKVTKTYTSYGDLSAGTQSSPRGNVCPSARSRAGRAFTDCVEKRRALPPSLGRGPSEALSGEAVLPSARMAWLCPARGGRC